MKTKSILFISLLNIFLINCSCENYYRVIAEMIELELGDILKNYSMVFIIPGSGCSGCISIAEDFFMDHVKEKKNLFILTHNFSKKNLLLKLKKENLEQDNVIVDNDDFFYLYCILNILIL